MFKKLTDGMKKNLNPMNLIKGRGKNKKKDLQNFVVRKEEISLGTDIPNNCLYRKNEIIVVRPNLNSILSGKVKADKYVDIDTLKNHILINVSQWDSIDMKNAQGEVFNVRDTVFRLSVLKNLCDKQGKIEEIKFNIKASNNE